MVQHQPSTRLLKLREVLQRRARGRSSHYQDIQNGTFTRPVKCGQKSSAWPESEVDAIIRARIAGQTEEEIRDLVQKLEAARRVGG